MEKKHLRCKTALIRRIAAFCHECLPMRQDCLAYGCPFYDLRVVNAKTAEKAIPWWQIRSGQWDEASFKARMYRELLDGENVFAAAMQRREEKFAAAKEGGAFLRMAERYVQSFEEENALDEESIVELEMPDLEPEIEANEEEKIEIAEKPKEEILEEEKKPKKAKKQASSKPRGRKPRAKKPSEEGNGEPTPKPKRRGRKKAEATAKTAKKSPARRRKRPSEDADAVR